MSARHKAGVGAPSAAGAARPWLPRWWALACAAGAGLALLAAFPPIGLWWTAPLGVTLLALATHRRGFWAGAALGLVTGVLFLVPLLSWAGGYIGAVWLFLPLGFAPFFALVGGACAAASPVIDRWPASAPLAVGSIWVAQEALRDRAPFGGFPWGRLAFSQADAPTLAYASLGGAPLVTFAVAASGGLIVAAALTLRSRRHAAAYSLGVLVVAALGALVPLPVGGAPVTVAIVQGNVPRLGLEFNAQRRAVLENHVRATLALAADVDAGRSRRPDLVVWPENASDVDPVRDLEAGRLIRQAADAIGVPILVGGLLGEAGEAGGTVRNVGMVWLPGHDGPTQTYVKRHPVPFAEYLPMRPLVRMITDKADMIRSDFVAGPVPGLLQVGPAQVGDVICFEVAYDDVVRDTVTAGAQLLVVQTNNATFNEAEARQQLAMVRLRAVEHGRSALMASTVGVSGFVDTTGAVSQATAFNQPAVVVSEVSLRTGRTMATELGIWPELLLVLAALGSIAGAVAIRRRAWQ